MATSGTVATTQLDAATLIEHAARRCGVLTSRLSAENLRDARENLFMLLCNLTNKGVNLWCVKSAPIALQVGVGRYALPPGVLDLRTLQFRSGTYTAATTLASGVATLDYGVGALAYVANVTLTAALAGAYSLVVESSNDAVTWVQRGTQTWASVAVGDLIGADTLPSPTARYWRLRETVLATTFTAALFTSAARTIPMSAYNYDDYDALPDQAFQASSVLQYFYDRQTPLPYLFVWPTANAIGPQVVLNYLQQIQDVGDLSNTIDAPQRYYLYIVLELAVHMSLTLPKELVPEGRTPVLVGLRDGYAQDAADGDTDGAPIRLTPRIRGYTR